MKRFAPRLLTLCLTLALLCTTAFAQTATDINYTVEEKLLKQLQAGSGFSGTLTLEATAVDGRAGEGQRREEGLVEPVVLVRAVHEQARAHERVR